MSTQPSLYDPSPSVLRILSRTFWSAGGWHGPVWPESDAMARAVMAGVMFDAPRTLDHDGWVQAARNAVATLAAEQVAAAFLASLPSHRLDLRSALGSYAVARFLPDHPVTKSGHRCSVCGQFASKGQVPRPRDLNVLNFERFKWGGVRRDDITYVAFDLEQFAKAPQTPPTKADIDLGRQVLGYLRQLPPKTTAAQAAAGLKLIRGSKDQRGMLIDILGVCGILRTADYPAYAARFVPASQRSEPSQRFIFGTYPTWWWKAEGGISDQALETFLPQLA